MTKEEVKEEFKTQEGDPLLKSRIRQQQRRFARQRMMAKVPKADVVITNPTHFAVALQYERESMRAPQVISERCQCGHVSHAIAFQSRGHRV